MDSATLRQRHKAAVGRWYRAMVDGDGTIPDGLISELGDIAEEHAGDAEAPPAAGRTQRRARVSEETGRSPGLRPSPRLPQGTAASA